MISKRTIVDSCSIYCTITCSIRLIQIPRMGNVATPVCTRLLNNLKSCAAHVPPSLSLKIFFFLFLGEALKKNSKHIGEKD